MEKLEKLTVNFPYMTRPVSVYKRENGHTIALAHKSGGLVNISSWVKTGSINENESNNGISHFLEHLMFKGTEKHPAGEFDRVLESKGAIVNAATWKDYTFYYVTLPKGDQGKDLSLTIELHADMMLNAILPEHEIGHVFDVTQPEVKEKRERHVVIEEIRMRQDQPWTKAYNQLNNAMYNHHPYKRDVIGTAEIISSLEQSTIMDYYKTHYTAENITTIVVGDFDEQEVLQKVIKEFEFPPQPVSKTQELKKEELREESGYIESKSDFTTGFMMFGYLGPRAIELKDRIALSMLSIILGEGQSSRFNQKLIEKATEPVFNLVSSEHYSFKDGSNFFVQANYKNGQKDKAIELIKSEMELICSEKVTLREFNKAKKRIKSDFAYCAETVSEIADTIGFYATVIGDIKAVEKYLDELESVTQDDLLDVAKRYLKHNRAVISVVSNE